MEVLEV